MVLLFWFTANGSSLLLFRSTAIGSTQLLFCSTAIGSALMLYRSTLSLQTLNKFQPSGFHHIRPFKVFINLSSK